MLSTFLAVALLIPAQIPTPAAWPGSHTRSIEWEGQKRSYHFYVPSNYDPAKAWPVVLALHGAGMNGKVMETFCGLNATADKRGFVAVYPNGTGAGNLLLVWNSGAFPGKLSRRQADDVGMIAKLLDDLASVVQVDPKRIYCTGMSNGGMMAYRLGAELSDRIAAIAPVAGTIVCDKFEPKRPVPVLHFHGTKDGLVPFEGSKWKAVPLPPVEQTIRKCIQANGCAEEPEVVELPPREGEKNLKVTRRTYNQGRDGAEVILYIVDGGGHTWPGRPIPNVLLGATTYAISANELMWEFFQKHPMK